MEIFIASRVSTQRIRHRQATRTYPQPLPSPSPFRTDEIAGYSVTMKLFPSFTKRLKKLSLPLGVTSETILLGLSATGLTRLTTTPLLQPARPRLHSLSPPVSFSGLHPRSHRRPGKCNFSRGPLSGILASHDCRSRHARLAHRDLPRDASSVPAPSISSVQCWASTRRTLGLLLPVG